MSALATIMQGAYEPLSLPPLTGPRAVQRRLEECARVIREGLRQAQNAPEPRAPAACWLIDNYTFIQAQIRETKRNLPAACINKLPKVGVPSKGEEPRIYRMAVDAVTQASGLLDSETLNQTGGVLKAEASLKLSELWAFEAMLRLVILEHFCADLDSETVVSNSIRSLRSLDSVSWRDFVESVSATEAILQRDPAGVYGAMDFATRDLYRQRVEKLAERSRLTETAVAKAAIACAQRADRDPRDVARHVGHYLIGAGADGFSEHLACKFSLRSFVSNFLQHWAGLLHACGFLLATTLILAGFRWLVGPLPIWIELLAVIPASQAALEIVNSIASHLLPPRPLPSMDFSEGIPDTAKAMIVVPTLLLSRENIEKLVEDLEIRYLANRDPNLYFALVTDFADAGQPKTEGDSILDECVAGIERLNSRYATSGSGPFYLFHRERKWNAAESKWMGYERKRGKLNDLNLLLLGRGNHFDTITGDVSQVAGIPYVITLDTDTRLPRDTAGRLVGAMAHPLNRPVVDPETGVVVDGYALIRPRVSVSMDSAERSLLSRIFSGLAGFDPYATTVSDVYQDLHGQASFTGKGIYDVRAFDAAVGDRFPDNAILSHDLIEGEHASTGLLASAELVEDYPVTYRAFSKRKHRWVRGDWQLLPWLLGHPPRQAGRAAKNPLSVLSRWKIFDNLRRSLVEISLVLLLVLGWIFVDHGRRWTLAVLALMLLSVYVDFLIGVIRMPEPRLWPAFARNLTAQFLRRHRDALLNLVFLPHQACLMADAIARTLVRLFVTKRKLLEWETMAQSEASGGVDIGMVEGYLYVTGASALVLLLAFESVSLAMALVCALWITAPLIARWLNGPPPNPADLTDQDRSFLRDSALRTWRFFADYSNADQRWLIPDNVQQDPPLIANRVSPTNLGLLVTSKLAAHDFGYLNLTELSVALSRIFESMENMPRYRGHFFNWYDTRGLCPISPHYVSSVDSGNLAASLCTLRQGCIALLKKPVLDASLLTGLRDHVLRLRDELPYSLKSQSVMRLVSSLLRQLECRPTDLFFFENVLTEASGLVTRIRESLQRQNGKLAELRYWERLLEERVNAALAELYALAPWLDPVCEPELRVNLRDASLEALFTELNPVPVLVELPDRYESIRERLLERLGSPEPLYPALRRTLLRLLLRLPEARSSALELIKRLEAIADDAFRYFDEMDFKFLFDKNRNLMRVGFDVAACRADESCYDLLASEARTAVFLAIAKGDVPREAWFRLGRKLTAYGNHQSLVSWSGTMFEYLMPLLHFRIYGETLLAKGMRGAVSIQQAYARERSMPWGISEAAYSARDVHMQYQYRAFGVPALSSNPGQTQSLVVAPYASMLALMLDPSEAVANLRMLASMGVLNRHGFFEAIDYSLSGKCGSEPIRCFMAHHQGMALLALDNTLLGGRMQQRFHLDPLVQATEFLLQERMPALVDIQPKDGDQAAA